MKKRIFSTLMLNTALILTSSTELGAKEVELNYIGDYISQRGRPSANALKKGFKMERQPLGVVVNVGQEITFTNKGEVEITISMNNEYMDDNYELQIPAGATVTYKNELAHPTVPLVKTPINSNNPDGTFMVDVHDAEKFETVPYYRIGDMTGESKYKVEGNSIAILNDQKEEYANFKFDNNSIIYTRHEGVSDKGVDYSLNLRGIYFDIVKSINKNSQSETFKYHDQQLVQLSQSNFKEQVTFSNPVMEDLLVEDDTIAMRIRNNIEFDDGYEYKKGVIYDLLDDNGQKIGNVKLLDNKLSAELASTSADNYIEIFDKNDESIKKISKEGTIDNFELSDGQKIKTHVGNVKHIKNSEGYYPEKNFVRRNFDNGKFTMTIDNEFIDVVDPSEKEFANSLEGKKFGFIEFEEISFLISNMDFFQNKDYIFHSLKDAAQFYGDYLEFADMVNAIPTENYYDPKFFAREEKDSGYYMGYWGNWYLLADETESYFRSLFGTMHEIGHSLQINVGDFYETEVSVNFTPVTYSNVTAYGTEEGSYVSGYNFSSLVEEYLTGTSYADIGQGLQNRTFMFIFQRFGDETLRRAQDEYMQIYVLNKTDESIKDFYVRKFSDHTKLNFIPYWDLIKIAVTDETRKELFKYEMTMPLSAVIPIETARERFNEINLPFYSALATQEEIDQLKINGNTKFTFDEGLIGTDYYIYDNEYKLVKKDKISSTEMIIEDVPVGYYLMSFDYKSDEAYAEKLYFLNSARQTNEFTVPLVENNEKFVIKASGLGSRVFSEFNVSGNKLNWKTTGSAPHSSWANEEYLSFDLKRGEEVIASKSLLGNVAYPTSENNETYYLQEGDILTITHQEGAWRLNGYVAGQNAPTYGEDKVKQYKFSNGALKPLINGEVNNDEYYELSEQVYADLLSANPDISQMKGYFAKEKAPTMPAKVEVNLGTEANESYVYAYDAEDNEISKAKVIDGVATLVVPRGTYNITSDYLADTYYYLNQDFKVNQTTNTNISLEKDSFFEQKYEYNLIYIQAELNIKVENNKLSLTTSDESLLEGLNIDIKDANGELVRTHTQADFEANELVVSLDKGQSFILNSVDKISSASLKNNISNNTIKINDLDSPIGLINNEGRIEQLNSLHRQLYINSLGKYYQANATLNPNGGMTNQEKYVVSLIDEELKTTPIIVGLENLSTQYLINNTLDFDTVKVYDLDGSLIEYEAFLVDKEGNREQITNQKKLTTLGTYTLEFEYTGKVGDQVKSSISIEVNSGQAPIIMVDELAQGLEQGKDYTFGELLAYQDLDSSVDELTYEIVDENGKQYKYTDKVNTKTLGTTKYIITLSDAQGNQDEKELFVTIVAANVEPDPDGNTDGGTDGNTDGGTDGNTDGGTDGNTDGGNTDGGTDGNTDGNTDGGNTDGGTDGNTDGGTDGNTDGGNTDGGTDGNTDGGNTDGGTDGNTDGGSTDGGNTDGGSTDGGNTDGGNTDGGTDGNTDGGSTDGGSTDGGNTDGGTDGNTDGGSTDGGNTDGGSTDGGSTDGSISPTKPIIDTEDDIPPIINDNEKLVSKDTAKTTTDTSKNVVVNDGTKVVSNKSLGTDENDHNESKNAEQESKQLEKTGVVYSLTAVFITLVSLSGLLIYRRKRK